MGLGSSDTGILSGVVLTSLSAGGFRQVGYGLAKNILTVLERSQGHVTSTAQATPDAQAARPARWTTTVVMVYVNDRFRIPANAAGGVVDVLKSFQV